MEFPRHQSTSYEALCVFYPFVLPTLSANFTRPTFQAECRTDEPRCHVVSNLHPRPHAILEKPLLEYCYKKDELEDPLISKEHIYSFGWATEKEIKLIDTMTLRINDLLSGIFRGIGIKLIDFKIEYGKSWNNDTKEKEIILVDEISPDTCRLWDIKTEKKLDKDRFRKDLGNVIQAYQEVARRLGIMPEETNVSEVNFGKTIPIKFKKK